MRCCRAGLSFRRLQHSTSKSPEKRAFRKKDVVKVMKENANENTIKVKYDERDSSPSSSRITSAARF